MTALAGFGPARRSSSSQTSLVWRVDVTLLVATLAVTGLGLLMVYSATRGTGSVPNKSFLDRQMTFAFVGVGLMAVTMLIDYRRLRELAALRGEESPEGTVKPGAKSVFGRLRDAFNPH